MKATDDLMRWLVCMAIVLPVTSDRHSPCYLLIGRIYTDP